MLFQRTFSGSNSGFRNLAKPLKTEDKPTRELSENTSIIAEEHIYFSGFDESDENCTEDFYDDDDDD